ncbi:hypothetical protein B0H14DRAFT_1567684 [Mycena olivaceomarginata]|nr:hypothetical protein B0H14DRAFT_1567684 [Mycena olivaceomarginata]
MWSTSSAPHTSFLSFPAVPGPAACKAKPHRLPPSSSYLSAPAHPRFFAARRAVCRRLLHEYTSRFIFMPLPTSDFFKRTRATSTGGSWMSRCWLAPPWPYHMRANATARGAAGVGVYVHLRGSRCGGDVQCACTAPALARAQAHICLRARASSFIRIGGHRSQCRVIVPACPPLSSSPFTPTTTPVATPTPTLARTPVPTRVPVPAAAVTRQVRLLEMGIYTYCAVRSPAVRRPEDEDENDASSLGRGLESAGGRGRSRIQSRRRRPFAGLPRRVCVCRRMTGCGRAEARRPPYASTCHPLTRPP